MNKLFLLSLLLLSSFFVQAQTGDEDLLSIEEIQLPNGDVDIYAVNKAGCPLTLEVTFSKLKNYKPSEKAPYTKVLMVSDESQFVIKVIRQKGGGDGFYGYHFNYGLGDFTSAKHNDRQVYLLPYKAGSQYYVGQGNHGRFSHHGVNAIDFDMDKGTPICAARAGTVVLFKQDSRSGCKSPKCMGAANYILIYHDDGSFGYYGHLEYNGVKVEKNQKVKAGQVIGRSGNTGWSSGPHLHFEVHVPTGINKKETIPVNFLLDKNKKGEPVAKKAYKAYHPG